VGGHGGIGSLFARLFGADGLDVLISDRDTALRNTDLAARCDLLAVAVSLRVTPDVLREVAPHLAPDATIVSLGSLMEPAAEALQCCERGTFLLHPLFGPGRKSLQGSTLVCASLRGGACQDWLLSWLQDRGALVVASTPEEHDRTMAVAQALLHGNYAALAPLIMRRLPAQEPLAWTSPTLRMQLGLMARILRQDPRLYGDLLALNRYAAAAFDELIERLTAVRRALADGPDAVGDLFSTACADLGPLGADLAADGDRALGEG
jgi:prephenate dehydrogenase